MINTHPALLPAFPGAQGVADALAYGVKVTGATVHLVDDGVDTGPVLAQGAVPVSPATTRTRCTNASRSRSGGCSWTPSPRWPGRGHRDRTRGDHPVSRTVGAAERQPVRRALISVYDKAGLPELATGLHALGVEIVSTGSTAQRIADAGVPVTPVEELTGFPECLDGRVKTLHPRVHAGLLADTRKPEHVAQLAELDIAPFELLVANLYPFTETVASGASPDECVEQIDIGGPAMVRASAKNHDSVAVVVDPERYDWVLEQVEERRVRPRPTGRCSPRRRSGTPRPTTSPSRPGWAACSRPTSDGPFPAWVGRHLGARATLRYGENPHQAAALYVSGPPGLARRGAAARQGDVLQQLRRRRRRLACRARPRGAVRRDHQARQPVRHRGRRGHREAHRKAHATDPVSAFGGVIAANREVSVGDGRAGRRGVHRGRGRAVLRRRRAGGAHPQEERRRAAAARRRAPRGPELRPISGGLLLQQRDAIDAPGDDPATWTLAAGDPVPDDVLADLAFAWRACRAVKSNAILLATGGAAVGIGMGQVNRVDSAASRSPGPVIARRISRGLRRFFPFPDGLEVLLDAGVRAVVQPGGSVRDHLVIEAAAAAGVPCTSPGRGTSPTDSALNPALIPVAVAPRLIAQPWGDARGNRAAVGRRSRRPPSCGVTTGRLPSI